MSYVEADQYKLWADRQTDIYGARLLRLPSYSRDIDTHIS